MGAVSGGGMGSVMLLVGEIEGDAELEDDNPAEDGADAEPSLGMFELTNQIAAWRQRDSGYGGVDLELDEADREPSLGTPENHPYPYAIDRSGDQAHWAGGRRDDRENDGDDLEPDGNDEPRFVLAFEAG